MNKVMKLIFRVHIGKKLIIISCLALTLLIQAGCNKETEGMQIIRVNYSADSGSIQPEMQWHEEILITREKAVLSRNGKISDTIVNVGSWDGWMDTRKSAKYFELLESINCSVIQRLETDDIPDGGGSSSYAITYANGKTCELFFSPGVYYPGSIALTGPIDELIKLVDFPREALLQIKP
jgi:hypothetical protein